MVIVSDTSILSNFFQIGQLDILRLVFHQLVIPVKVAEELQQLSHFGFDVSWVNNTDWMEIRQVSHADWVTPLLSTVDAGEAEAIVLAKELQADYILIDDLQGRQVAVQQGLTVIGSLGILLKAKQAGHIPLIRPLMDDLMSIAKAFIAPKLYADVLLLAGE